MSQKEVFAEQLKAQGEVWQAQLVDYQQKLELAGETARGEYKKALQQMETQARAVNTLLQGVRDVNEAAWKDVETARQKAFAELQKGWADAISRFTLRMRQSRKTPDVTSARMRSLGLSKVIRPRGLTMLAT
jgi:hypothetical protein